MIFIGLEFLITWLQVQVFNVDLVKSLLVTAIIFIVLGFVMGERPFANRR
jgi:hypothetical protein